MGRVRFSFNAHFSSPVCSIVDIPTSRSSGIETPAKGWSKNVKGRGTLSRFDYPCLLPDIVECPPYPPCLPCLLKQHLGRGEASLQLQAAVSIAPIQCVESGSNGRTLRTREPSVVGRARDPASAPNAGRAICGQGPSRNQSSPRSGCQLRLPAQAGRSPSYPGPQILSD